MHALVRRLPAVEALGSTTVICTDKTGTLTRNEMTVRAFDVAGQRVEVTGTGYAVEGDLRVEGQKVEPKAGDGRSALRLALRIGALCNDAKLDRSQGSATVLGDPTEAALIVAAEKAGLDRAALQRDYPRLQEDPLQQRDEANGDRAQDARRTHRRVRQGITGSRARGERIAPRSGCGDTDDDGGARARSRNEPGARGRSDARTGLAYRELPEPYNDEDLARDLTFVGFVGMIDPLRDEAKATIATCREAGIRAIMITGDQQATAAEIASQLGLDVDAQGRRLRTVHARELSALDDDGWKNIVADAAVFARVSPEHKLRIVEALQSRATWSR